MKKEEEIYEARFQKHIDELKWLYMELYDDQEHFDELCASMKQFYDTRKKVLKASDLTREADPNWYKGSDILGMMMYTKMFGGNLKGVKKHLDYLKKCGINYLHLMPLMESPKDRSDGGYAVADFRKVQPELGTIRDLESLASECRKQGISICLDFVMNHTSEDHEWAKRARAGEKEYQDRYFFYDNWDIPSQFEKTVPQVFPTTAPGNFTWLPEIEKVVMTTFYPYQWDLNYANPVVFNEMMYNFLFLANKGIDIIRIFDCLNDVRNLQTAVTACNKEKGHAQVALSYTLGDAYTLDYWMEMAKRVEDMGADSLCIKDMAGLLVPQKATELIQALKSSTSLPIELHTHYTSGVASMTYMKAVEAGCDIIDTAMSPFALGTSQPATEVMVEAFKGTQYDTGLDQNKLAEIADYFRPMREEALDSGLMNPKVLGVNIKTLLYQVPGGMLSNLISQLKEQGQEDKYEEVLAEVPRVRKDLGEPPLVTPSSQIVGTQAVFNVLMGERYKVATKETKDILLGKYGQTVKPFNPEVVDKVLGADKDKAITCRPADLLEPELDKIEAEMKQYKQQDEDVLSYALFPQVATEFFKYRQAQQTKVDTTIADTKNGAYPV